MEDGLPDSSAPPPTFRAGVGAAIFDGRGRVLGFERRDIAGTWQLPQGGLNGGEAVHEALWRELAEETGLGPDELDVLAEVPEWLGYALPPDARSSKTGYGQVHKWFILTSRSETPPVRLDQSAAEFRACRWMELATLAETTAEFRRPVYRRLAAFAHDLFTSR